MFIIELLGDYIIDTWFALMQLIVPKTSNEKNTRIIQKAVVGIFSCLLLVSLTLGIFAIISDDSYTHVLGQYMVFIPLCISAVQIILGIIVHIVE